MTKEQIDILLPPGAQPEIDRTKYEKKMAKRTNYMRGYLRDRTELGKRFIYGGPAYKIKDKAPIDIWPIRPITLNGVIVGSEGMFYSVKDDAGMEFRINVEDWMDRTELGDRPLTFM